MAPRQRKGRSKGLPPNLYANTVRGVTYYRYQDGDGHWYGLGRDKKEAIRQAMDANLRRSGSGRELSQRIERRDVPTVAEVGADYLKWVTGKGRAKNTIKTLASQLRLMEPHIGSIPLPDLTTRHCAEYLEAVRAEGKDRQAQALRSTLKHLLNYAISCGHISDNVATNTLSERVESKRARLTLEQFLAIHDAAGRLDAWVQRSMELALVSGQPREVVSAALFSDFKDGAWWCRRGKTGVQIMLPLELHCNAVGWSLDAVVKACRDRVVSRYVLHHTRSRNNARPGAAVHIDTISRKFAEARDMAGIKGGQTFHEIRSLAGRLYKDQGIDTQALFGHKDPRTTALYQDSRGAEWVRVKV